MTGGWRTGLILGALGISLVLNVVALMRIGDLRGEVDHVRHDASRVSSLESQIRTAEQRLGELEEE